MAGERRREGGRERERFKQLYVCDLDRDTPDREMLLLPVFYAGPFTASSATFDWTI